MKAYPKYKDSGVPWLGAVPEHWEVLRLGSQFVERKQKVSDEDFAPLSVTKNGILPQLDSAAKSNDGDNRKKVCSGDFVINSRSDRKGSSGVSPLTGSVSLINTVLTSLSLDGRYAHNFFRSHAFKEEFYRVGRGIVADLWSTKYSDMRTIMIPVPSQAEQQQIARYLDWQSSKINKFIKAKKKLISLLKEQKQNIINGAVTKGINPDVEMKESGVEWLGEIPAHWEVRRAKYLFKQEDIRSETGKEELLSVSHLTGVSPRSQKSVNMFLAENYIGSKICKPGFIAVNTMWAWMAALGVSKFEGVISSSYHTYSQKAQFFDETFLDILLRSLPMKSAYTVNSSGITSSRMRLYPDDFLRLFFVCPPISEQQGILAYIETETAIIDKTIARTEREIELIQEYRTRLVSDIVTGKVDLCALEIPDFESVEVDPEVQDDGESEMRECANA